jgi:hypothetical protein
MRRNTKKKWIILSIIVACILSGLIAYDFVYPTYTIENAAVEVSGSLHKFHQGNWRHIAVNERIGYIDMRFSKVFSHFLPTGLYSVRDDENNYFLQPLKFISSMNYNLLVREDIDLTVPEVNNISEIKVKNRIGGLTDSNIIADIVNLYSNTSASTPQFPVRVHNIRVYSKLYPGIYYSIELLQPDDGTFWLRSYDSEQRKDEYALIPGELVHALRLHES